ncbi:MAG: diaminopimelate decarboxylase [Bacillota bacterium]
MNDNSIQKNHFVFDGCDTVELASLYGTPLYVVSENRIREKCREVRERFLNKYENTRAVYAGKAFLTMAMCKIIESEGLGLDVVSGGELYTALKAGFPVEYIMFHGNNKSYDEISMAVENNVGRIVVDNVQELDLLNSITKDKKKTVKILFRITPGIEGKTHKYITTGQKDSKFGIPLEMEGLKKAVEKALDYEYIELMGFHFHVGSQLFENSSHLASINIVTNIMKYMKEKVDFTVKETNVGGGFGVYYAEGDTPQTLSYFTDSMMEQIAEKCKAYELDMPKVIIEPGRWIVAEAGVTLYKIGTIKEIPNVRTYVSVDGGMPDNPRPALYGARYEAFVANKIKEKKEQIVTIAGKCCESGDILIKDLTVPRVEAGDILAVLGTGAYNYSMASNYNKIPKPAVVLVKDGRARVIVKRETYEDLITKESIPEDLL